MATLSTGHHSFIRLKELLVFITKNENENKNEKLYIFFANPFIASTDFYELLFADKE